MPWNLPTDRHIHKLDRNSACACGFVLETEARRMAAMPTTPVDRRMVHLTCLVQSRAMPMLDRTAECHGVQGAIECLEQIIRELKVMLPRS
jgi:hypothetical protein